MFHPCFSLISRIECSPVPAYNVIGWRLALRVYCLSQLSQVGGAGQELLSEQNGSRFKNSSFFFIFLVSPL